MNYMFYAKERVWVESQRKLKYRNASSKNTVLPGARVCWFTSMVLGLPASTKMVSLVGGLLGGHYSPAPSVVGHC